MQSHFEVLGMKEMSLVEWKAMRRQDSIIRGWLNTAKRQIRSGAHDDFHALYTATSSIFRWSEDTFYAEEMFKLFLCHVKTSWGPKSAWDGYNREFILRGARHQSEVEPWVTNILLH